jgi:excinuclease ABC subunit C
VAEGVDRRSRLAAIVERLPETPGVYIFKDVSGAVAYVGKALRLRDRVRSYFSPSTDARRAVRFVDRYVHDISFVSTESEHEAFLLENQLVKRHHPAYNIKLRDDKDFLYVRVDRRHEFPALTLARRPRGGHGKLSYHGPFAHAGALRRTLRMLGGILPLRDCSDRELASRTRPCLKYEMGRCSAPCVGLIDHDDYTLLLDEALDVLEGRCEKAILRLEGDMVKAADEMRFEEAARQRDAIRYLRATTARQQVENIDLEQGDVLGMHRAGELVEVVLQAYREGALVSTSNHTIESELPDGEVLAGFLLQFYGASRPVAREVLLPCALPDVDGLGTFLESTREGAVRLSFPRRGDRVGLVNRANRNAKDALVVAIEQRGHQRRLLESLGQKLSLPRVPERIECYDVSNTGRTAVVASRVVFSHGEPDRASYRHYRIRTIDGQDDYGAMREVLLRRFARAATDPLPDLLIVDGGRSHLQVAIDAAKEAGLPDLSLAALAKGGRRGRAVTLGADEQERVFLPNREDPLVMEGHSPEEYLLQRLRDEAHRFAIGHHRKLRSKESLSSRLDDVPGVGPVLKKRLLGAFGGTRALARASAGEVAGVRGVGPELAQEILDHLHRTGG